MQVYELSPARFELAAPLFVEAWYDRAYIDAVFEGSQVGRVFVDHAEQPTAALLCRTYDYFVAGDTGANTLRRFMADAPGEAEVFDTLYSYVPLGDSWRQALLQDHGARLEVIERRSFTFPAAAFGSLDPWQQLPEGTVVRQVDRALVERIDAELHEHIELLWGDYDRFLDNSFGFCTLVGDELASVGIATGVSTRYSNISTSTAEPFRRRGLAAAGCAACIAESLRRGLVPTWDCDAPNLASAALATRLGFVEDGPFWELAAPGRAKLDTSHGLWVRSTSPDQAGEPTIWMHT